jgi:hypothetical protein
MCVRQGCIKSINALLFICSESRSFRCEATVSFVAWTAATRNGGKVSLQHAFHHFNTTNMLLAGVHRPYAPMTYTTLVRGRRQCILCSPADYSSLARLSANLTRASHRLSHPCRRDDILRGLVVSTPGERHGSTCICLVNSYCTTTLQSITTCFPKFSRKGT